MAQIKMGDPADFSMFMGAVIDERAFKRLEQVLTAAKNDPRVRIVAGDQRLASLIALYARGRPSLYLDSAPDRTPWVTAEELQRDGAIVVWPTTDTAGAPPPEIKARFPDLVPEVPRAFDYPVQGRLPLLRIGWGMLRPQ